LASQFIQVGADFVQLWLHLSLSGLLPGRWLERIE